MALQSSGSITIQDIANEFGGNTPHSLSEYYDAASGVPSSGTIKISDFYGTSAVNPTTIYGVQSTKGFPSHDSSSLSTSMSLGTAYSDREVWVVVTAYGGNSITSVTIGGQQATKVAEESGGGYASQMPISYWKYKDDGALGTSATVSVDYSESILHTGLLVFTSKTSSLLAFYGSNNENGAPTPGSIATSKDGWAFYFAVTQNASPGSIGEFGNNGNFDAGSNEWVTYGFNSPENDGTVAINSPSGDGSSSNTISGLSTGPLGDTIELSFYENRYGADMGAINIYVVDTSGNVLSGPIYLASGNMGNTTWYARTAQIPKPSVDYRLAFHYLSGASFEGDYAIDLVKIGSTTIGNEFYNESWLASTSNTTSASTALGNTQTISTSITNGIWNANAGSTGSTGTGPSGAYSGSYYAYTEVTSNFNVNMWLFSPIQTP